MSPKLQTKGKYPKSEHLWDTLFFSSHNCCSPVLFGRASWAVSYALLARVNMHMKFTVLHRFILPILTSGHGCTNIYQNWLQTACYVTFSDSGGELARYSKPALKLHQQNAGSKTLKQKLKKGATLLCGISSDPTRSAGSEFRPSDGLFAYILHLFPNLEFVQMIWNRSQSRYWQQGLSYGLGSGFFEDVHIQPTLQNINSLTVPYTLWRQC